MQNYFLNTTNKKLFDILKDLDSYPMDINGMTGFILSKEDDKNLVEFLTEFIKHKDTKGINKLGLKFTNTGYEGIKGAFLFVDVPHKITVETWNGKQKEEFINITREILGGIIDKPISIYVPHGESHKPLTKNFNIFIWSSSKGVKSADAPPETIFGHKVMCRDLVVPPTYDGILLYSDNYVVAEFINGNNLYIHHDACHEGHSEEFEIYRKVLIEVANILMSSDEDREKRLIDRVDKNRDIYVNLCLNRIRLEFDERRDKILELKSDIAELKEDLIESIRELEKEELLILNFDKAIHENKEKYATEFDKLIKLNKVIGVDISNRGVEVFTDTLFCKDPKTNKVHEIGKFKITIPIGSGVVNWNNLTRKVKGYREGMNTPHIYPEGHACLGNAEQVLPELIATYQFSIIATYAIQFVESVNINDSAGKHLKNWPVAKGDIDV